MRWRVVLALVVLACRRESAGGESHRAPATGGSGDERSAPADPYAAARERMVAETIEARGVTDPALLAALRRVPRHALVPESLRPHAYDDQALPIGFDQTISQPYVVAAMTEAARLKPGARVLEVGTGSGYQAIVLAELGAEVYSIEIVEPLALGTRRLLAELGYEHIRLRVGDGYSGWPEAAPFDAIVVTAAPPRVPEPLIEQLALGGRLVIPVGPAYDQHLRVFTRTAEGTSVEDLFPVRFVPMTGEAQR